MITRLIPIVLLAYSISLAQDKLSPGFDLRDENILTAVKHQLNCGSCGEFAAVALFEALIKKETGVEVDLSEQQIVSCVPGCGCNSGCSSSDALKYIKENGIALESDFPYLDKDTVCASGLPARYYITDVFSTVIAKIPLDKRIEKIKETVNKYGPVATNMTLYDDLGQYKNGIYSYDGNPTRREATGWLSSDGRTIPECLPADTGFAETPGAKNGERKGISKAPTEI